MGILGSELKDRLTTVTHNKYPDQPAVDNPNIDIDYTNAFGDAIEDFVSGQLSLTLEVPQWAAVDPLVETIIAPEPDRQYPIITLNWQAPTDPTDLAGVRVFRKEYNSIADEWGPYRVVVTVPVDQTSYEDDTVYFNRTYRYALVFLGPGNTYSDLSTEEELATSSFPEPVVPSDKITTTPGYEQIGLKLEGVHNLDSTISYYEIEVREADAIANEEGGYVVPLMPSWSAWALLSEVKSTRVVHNGLELGKCYQYRYRAINQYGVASIYNTDVSIDNLSDAVIPLQDLESQSSAKDVFADSVAARISESGGSAIKYYLTHSLIDPKRHPVYGWDDVDNDAHNRDAWYAVDTGQTLEFDGTNGLWEDPFGFRNYTLMDIEGYAADGVITVAEKVEVADIWATIAVERLLLSQIAGSFLTETDQVARVVYGDAFDAVNAYLHNIVDGILKDTGSDSNVDPVEFRLKFRNYIAARKDFGQYLIDSALVSHPSDLLYNSANVDSQVLTVDGSTLLAYLEADADRSIQFFSRVSSLVPNITTMVTGDLLYEIDTDLIYQYDGASWVDITGTSSVELEAFRATDELRTIFNPATSGDLPAVYQAGDILIPSNDMSTGVSPTVSSFQKAKVYVAVENSTGGFEGESWVLNEVYVEDSALHLAISMFDTLPLDGAYTKGDVLVPAQDETYNEVGYGDVTFVAGNVYVAISDSSGSFSPADFGFAQKFKDYTGVEGTVTKIEFLDDQNIVTPNEKISLKQEFDGIVGEVAQMKARADQYSADTATYQKAYDDLNDFLNGANGPLQDLETRTMGLGLWDNLIEYITAYKTARADLEENIGVRIEGQTQEQIQYGFDNVDIGATTTPAAITGLESHAEFKSVALKWDRQNSLTNFKEYVIQVSDDPNAETDPESVDWYSLRNDGQDWKGTLNGETRTANSFYVHSAIPNVLDPVTGVASGRVLFYRVRIRTMLDLTSPTWAYTIGFTHPINGDDIGQDAIDARHIVAGSITATEIDVVSLMAQQLTIQSGGWIKAGPVTLDETGLAGPDFSLTATGLVATNASISGTITATLGTIGGWTVGTDTLTGGDISLVSDGEIRVGAATERVILTSTDLTYRIRVGNETAGTYPFSVGADGSMYATAGEISGWNISDLTLSKNDATISSEGFIVFGTGSNIVRIDSLNATYRLWAGDSDPSLAAFSVTTAGVLSATGANISGTLTATAGTIGGWSISNSSIQSATDGSPRIEMNPMDNRVEVWGSAPDVDPKVAMGYLGGLPKNDGTGDWGSNDYGFWAISGDKLQIDGEIDYINGDWLVQNDASLKLFNAGGYEVLRLGTENGTRGLHFYNPGGVDVVASIAPYYVSGAVLGLNFNSNVGIKKDPELGTLDVNGSIYSSSYITAQNHLIASYNLYVYGVYDPSLQGTSTLITNNRLTIQKGGLGDVFSSPRLLFQWGVEDLGGGSSINQWSEISSTASGGLYFTDDKRGSHGLFQFDYGNSYFQIRVYETETWLHSYGNIRPYKSFVPANGGLLLGSDTDPWGAIYGTTFYENGTSLSSKYAPSSHTHSASQITEISALTDNEGAQLENINSVTISNTQWGYLGAMNQSVATTSTPTFTSIYIADYIYHSGDTDTYMQFHASDQWRVVTSGAERLAVTNTTVQITSANLALSSQDADKRIQVMAENGYNAAMLFGEGSGTSYYIGFNYNANNNTLTLGGWDNLVYPTNQDSPSYTHFKVARTSPNITFGGNLFIPSIIYHDSDTDTYMQFHGADEWRVVAGGTEHLAVNANYTIIDNALLLRNSTDRAGLLEHVENGTTGYTGYQITRGNGQHWSWMGDDTSVGWYDDTAGEWTCRYYTNAYWSFYANGEKKLQVNTANVTVYDDLLPNNSSSHDLGSSTLAWDTVYANHLVLGGGTAIGAITISTSAPSGGANGDIWHQV